MTLDEAIKYAKEVAEEREKALRAWKECDIASVVAEYYKIAEWLKDYKRLLEQKSCDNAISRAEAIRIASGYCHHTNIPKELGKLPSVWPEQRHVLNRIRAEVKKMGGDIETIAGVLAIIDKYKKENEEG
jgi:hypothetical protein